MALQGAQLNETIASDYSPSPSPMDRAPEAQEASFAAALRGYTGNGGTAMWDGSPTDFNIAEDFGVDELAALLGQFAVGEGANILTVTTASPTTFDDAPAHPEKYDLLRVRMGGWTEYFTSMFPDSQQQHLRRPLSTPEAVVED